MVTKTESEFEQSRQRGAFMSEAPGSSLELQQQQQQQQPELIPQPQEQPQEQLQNQPQSGVEAKEAPVKKEKEEGFVSKTVDTVVDLAMAPLRGVEGAVEGIYNLVDWVTGDRLWDWDRDEHTAFGRSKTMVGGFTEGLVQFGVGFIPGLGTASWLGKASKLGKVGQAISKSKEALKSFSKGTLSLSPSTMQKMSKLKSGTKEVIRNATAGAISDFAVFKADEERLSNLLARYDTDESNILIQSLAYDPEREVKWYTEVVERGKNAIEGAIVGEVLGAAFVGIKAGAKAIKGFPEKEAAVSGLQKTFNKIREKNKIVGDQRYRGEEVDELDAVDKALSNPENQLTPDEIKAGRELNKRIHDLNKAKEFEELTGVKPREIDRSPDVEEATKTLKETKAPEVKQINPEEATEEELDAWLRENAKMTGANSSVQTKREAVKDIIEQSKEGGTEHLIKKLEEQVINTVKKAGLYDETNPQAMLSAVRLVRSVPEMRALLSSISRVALKASENTQFNPEQAKRFYDETNELLGLGVEAAGGKASKIYLDQFRDRVEDLRMVRAEAEVLYDAMNAAAKDINTKMNQAQEAADRVTVEVKDGKQTKVLNSEQAMTELYSAMDRFSALQEIWADFGTQLSLGMRQRQDLYRTGQSSLGRDIAGQHRQLGMAVEDAIGQAGKLFRRQMAKGGASDKRVLKDLQKLFKKSGSSPDVGDLVRDLNSVGINKRLSTYTLRARKGLAISQEWYYNAILGSPTTWVVNALGNSLVLPLRHIESAMGGAMTGNLNLVKANFRAFFDIQSVFDAFKYAWRSGVEDEARSISGYTAFRDDRLTTQPKGEIYVHNPDGNIFYSAFNFLGKVIRHPSRIMMTGDEFFKQMSFRSRIKTALALEGYQKGLHRNPGKLAEYINEGFEGMITKDGRFRNEDNVRKEAYLALQKARKAGEDVPNERVFIQEYMDNHYFNNNLTLEDGIIYQQKGFEEREVLVESGKEWALVNTFTNEVTNPFFKKTGEVATMYPSLGFLIPFVRTPSNIILFALGRTLPKSAPRNLITLRGRSKALEAVEASNLAKNLEDMPESKRMAENYLRTLQNETSIKAGEELGRLAVGGVTLSAIFMNLETLGEKVTGSAPKDEGKRAAWEATGKKEFSIQVGDKWYSYQRLDPFATTLGILADISQGFRDVRETGVSEMGGEDEFVEKEAALHQIAGILAMSFANNISNKSYIENIGELLDILEAPTEKFSTISSNVIAGFVPNGLNWSQNVYQEQAPVLEARSLMDKIMRRLPESMRSGEKLMPKRNFLGEIERKENTGSVIKGINPIFSSTISNDIVDMEIEHQAVGRKRMEAGRNVGGRQVSYRNYRNEEGQTAYDRMQELSGTLKLGPQRLTLRQSLRRLIESNDYQKLPPITENYKSENHPRSKEISKIISRYRAEARRRTLSEYSQLKQDLFKLLQ